MSSNVFIFDSPPPQSLSLAFAQNSFFDLLSLDHDKKKWCELFLTSYIFYFTV